MNNLSIKWEGELKKSFRIKLLTLKWKLYIYDDNNLVIFVADKTLYCSTFEEHITHRHINLAESC